MFSTTKVMISLLTSLLTFLAIELMEDLLMHRDSTAFRNRFERWKNGELVYENGRVIPEYETGKGPLDTDRPESILTADKSDSDFIKRLKAKWRLEIWDWERSGKAVTHKMSSADNIVYPNVLTAGGGLIDFTNPIWEGVVDPYERAIRTKDYVPMKTEQDAIWFGPNYKKYYPKFADGKGYRYLYDDENKSFNRITDDINSRLFADITVTPKGNKITPRTNPIYHDPRFKYAKYVTKSMLEDEYNTKRLTETNMYAPGLELIHPEFDVINFYRPILNEISRFKNWKGVKLVLDKNDIIQYNLLNRKGDRIGDIQINTYDDIADIDWIESKQKGGGRMLMDAAILNVREKGMYGIRSGRDLLSAPKTYRMWKHYPDKQLLSHNGTHTNLEMVYTNSPVISVPTKKAAIEKWNKGELASFGAGDVYLLKSPSQHVQYWTPYKPDLLNVIIPITNSTINHAAQNK